jgi:uncharacterized Ntn-hydrolase superfamily protein
MKLSSIVLLVTAFRNVDELKATLTIAAADTVSGEIGAIGISCDSSTSLFDLSYHSSTGNGLCLTVGAVVPDLITDASIYTTIDAQLLLGTDPSVILGLITDPLLDVAIETVFALPLSINYDAVDLRQYACVDLQLRADAYTGTQITDYYVDIGFDLATYGSYVSMDIQGLAGSDIVYSAQGDIVSATTVDILAGTFSLVSACDLAERLYLALEAVHSDPTLGDVRCLNSKGSIFIHVEDSSGATILHIETTDATSDPWIQFQTDYLTWRALNDCPSYAPSSPPSISSAPSTSLSPTTATRSPTSSSSASPTSASYRVYVWQRFVFANHPLIFFVFL